jgi:hypothetical protein
MKQIDSLQSYNFGFEILLMQHSSSDQQFFFAKEWQQT